MVSGSALREARLAIVAAADELRAVSVSVVAADNEFCRAYNAREITLDPTVYAAIRSVSSKTLYNWRAAVKAGDLGRLEGSTAGHREGTSCLAIGNDGKVAAFIAAILERQPHLRAEQIRKLVAAEFGETLTVKRAGGRTKLVALPEVYGFRRHMAPIKRRMKEMRDHAQTNAQQILGPNAEAILREIRRTAGVNRDGSEGDGV
jgi:hypothetical protein